jgi:septal ring factor EnvC (AmiA/AmiB activator)
MQAQMSKNFVLTADFETFKAKIANADQVKEERNEVFKQLRSSAQKAQDLETVLANFGNEISELTHELRKKALFAEVQVLERKVDKLPTFSNLHNIEKMFADYTAC